jgi:hypothetical protein
MQHYGLACRSAAAIPAMLPLPIVPMELIVWLTLSLCEVVCHGALMTTTTGSIAALFTVDGQLGSADRLAGHATGSGSMQMHATRATVLASLPSLSPT